MNEFTCPPNDLPAAPNGPILFTLIQLSHVQPALTPAMLRDLVKGAATNGFDSAIHYINGRTCIDVVEFYHVLANRQSERIGGASHA